MRNWVTVLERVYGVFRIPPFGPAKIKAVKKEQKLYFWDWTRVEAVYGEHAELRYFRDVNGHEVDFIVLFRKQPWLAIEVKSGDKGLSPGLRYLLERTRFTFACQVSGQGGRDQLLPPIGGTPMRLMPLARFLACLP